MFVASKAVRLRDCRTFSKLEMKESDILAPPYVLDYTPCRSFQGYEKERVHRQHPFH